MRGVMICWLGVTLVLIALMGDQAMILGTLVGIKLIKN